MIRCVEGVPGSGKSYYAMAYLTKYCDYDAFYDEFVLKPGVLIISNIDGLKVKHKSLDELLKKYPVEQFFTVENFEKIQVQYKVTNILVIIDEAQKIFDSKFYDKDVFYLFQYHRHLGLDVFLLTQSRTTIARHLIPLCEYVIEAQPRSKGLAGTFRYKFLSQKGQFLYHKVLKKDQKVFRAYKSFTFDEIDKPKNLLTRYAVALVVCFIICVASFKGVFAWIKNQQHASNSSRPGTLTNPSIPSSPRSVPVSAVQSAYTSKVVRQPIPSFASPPFQPLQEYAQYPLDGYVDAGGGLVAVSINGKNIKLPNYAVKSYSLTHMVAVARVDVFGVPGGSKTVFSTGVSQGPASLEPPEKGAGPTPVGKTGKAPPA